MGKFKIIFSDIDGTLLNSSHEVSEKNKESLVLLNKLNIPFVLVSARMPQGIKKVQKEINVNSPIVCYSGGLVIDSNGKYLMSIGIRIEKAQEIKNYIDGKWKNVSTSYYSYDKWIADNKKDEWIAQESNITSVNPIFGKIQDICEKNSVVHKILCMGDSKVIDEIKDSISEKYEGLSIYKSKDTYLEIMDLDATKSGAMKVLCDSFNIKMEDAISIGDNYNDVDMIKASGNGIAMGNAPDEVKRISNELTSSNDDDGVAEVIYKYF